MTDPLGDLEDSLAYLFELQTTGKDYYINFSVKKLKKALEHYKNYPSESLESLTVAVINALPVIDNYVDSYQVKKKMDYLAELRGKSIEWYSGLVNSYH